jgi:hypothetical protein
MENRMPEPSQANLGEQSPFDLGLFQNLSVKKGETRLAKKELGSEFFPRLDRRAADCR